MLMGNLSGVVDFWRQYTCVKLDKDGGSLHCISQANQT